MNARDIKEITWRSPSNIAIVKYWGKRFEQIPENPSLSLTLSKAHTTTRVTYTPGSNTQQVNFFFEGEKNPGFASRVQKYVDRMSDRLPILKELNLTIETENSFPHSAGIASSASAMSALALCLCSIAYEEEGKAVDESFDILVSDIARLGSGSASRSVIGPVVLWGQTDEVPGSSDEHAIRVKGIDPVFHTMCDSILMVDTAAKSVKSSEGHALMEGHPFAQQRFAHARENLAALLEAMYVGNLGEFGSIAETEALELHAMMMTSNPSYLLMRPGTLSIIEELRAFRQKANIPVYFTLDAGPNVHLLYPQYVQSEVQKWIDEELLQFCSSGRVLHDQAGDGPVLMHHG